MGNINEKKLWEKIQTKEGSGTPVIIWRDLENNEKKYPDPPNDIFVPILLPLRQKHKAYRVGRLILLMDQNRKNVDYVLILAKDDCKLDESIFHTEVDYRQIFEKSACALMINLGQDLLTFDLIKEIPIFSYVGQAVFTGYGFWIWEPNTKVFSDPAIHIRTGKIWGQISMKEQYLPHKFYDKK